MTKNNLEISNKSILFKSLGLYSQAGLYVFAGIGHFLHPMAFVSIMPGWIPDQHKLVFITGIMEMTLGILLLVRSTRRFAAWGIVLFLIAVFPANIQMAINYFTIGHSYFWLTILRLPLQFLLIWCAWIYTKPVNP